MDKRTDYERQLSFKTAVHNLGSRLNKCTIPVNDRVTRCSCDIVRLLNNRDCQPLIMFHEQEPLGRIVHAKTYVDELFDHTGSNLDAYVNEGTTLLSRLSVSLDKGETAPGAIHDDHNVLVYLYGERLAARITPTGIVDWKYDDELTLLVQHDSQSFYAICPPGNLYAQDPAVRYTVSCMLRERD